MSRRPTPPPEPGAGAQLVALGQATKAMALLPLVTKLQMTNLELNNRRHTSVGNATKVWLVRSLKILYKLTQ